MFKKEFWKYFFNTFKESKWLLVRYVVIGIYLIVVGIIANKLQLHDLTYYNSIITLAYFAEMIAFGCSEGFGIYVNQHAHEPKISRKYAKVGFYVTILVVLIFVVLLGAMPNVILKNILHLDFEVNLWFYYIMLIAMVFLAGFRYINTLLARLKVFNVQLITSLSQCALVALSLLLLVLFKNLSLIPIAIIYVLVYLTVLIVSLILLKRNKIHSINILKYERLKLEKHEIRTIVLRCLAEIVWEVGYMFISFFILKANVILYNQYCYFENALDIFNGVFFTFVKLTSIRICTAIGERKRDEAFKHAKYSIYASIVIWFFYALVSFALYLPLKSAMNIDLQATALIPYILYVALSLFRFVNWTMGTYIIGQSEIYINYQFWIEVVFAIYWVLLYLLADIFKGNMYLIFGAIALECTIKIIIDSIKISNKRWTYKFEEGGELHIEEKVKEKD